MDNIIISHHSTPRAIQLVSTNDVPPITLAMGDHILPEPNIFRRLDVGSTRNASLERKAPCPRDCFLECARHLLFHGVMCNNSTKRYWYQHTSKSKVSFTLGWHRACQLSDIVLWHQMETPASFAILAHFPTSLMTPNPRRIWFWNSVFHPEIPWPLSGRSDCCTESYHSTYIIKYRSQVWKFASRTTHHPRPPACLTHALCNPYITSPCSSASSLPPSLHQPSSQTPPSIANPLNRQIRTALSRPAKSSPQYG